MTTWCSMGKAALVNAFAENRANDLIKALAAPNRNQGFIEMRAFVENKGYLAQLARTSARN